MRSQVIVILAVVLAVEGAASRASANAYVNNAYVNNAYVNNAYVNNAYVNNAYVNAAYVNSGPLLGTWMPGLTKAGTPIQYVSLDGSQLTGWTYEWGYDPASGWGWRWSWHDGGYFTGTSLAATTKNPNSGEELPLSLWIADAVGAGSNAGDVWAYLVYAFVPLDSGESSWVPLCGYDGSQNPVYAMPLYGEWDYSSGTVFGGSKLGSSGSAVTFACLTGALGKCAASGFPNTMGYLPWRDYWRCIPDATGACVYTLYSGEDVHQACTRMVRADYCGDGTAHTYSGTRIDVYDQLTPAINVTSTAPPPGWPTLTFEALWGVRGATHLGCERYDLLDYDRNQCPLYVDPSDPSGTPVRHQLLRTCATPGWDLHDPEPDSLIGNANTRIHDAGFSSAAPSSISSPP